MNVNGTQVQPLKIYLVNPLAEQAWDLASIFNVTQNGYPVVAGSDGNAVYMFSKSPAGTYPFSITVSGMNPEPIGVTQSGPTLKQAMCRRNWNQKGTSRNHRRYATAGIVSVVLVSQMLVYACGRAQAQDHLTWTTSLTAAGNTPLGAPATNATSVFFATSRIERYSREDGSLKWSVPVHHFEPHGLSADGAAVYVAEQSVYALKASTGELLWERSLPGNAAFCRTLLNAGMLFVGTEGGQLEALRSADGHLLWTTTIMNSKPYLLRLHGISLSDHVLYVTGEDARGSNGTTVEGRVAAVDARTGKLKWSYRSFTEGARHAFIAAPAIGSGLVVVGDATANEMVALEQNTGVLRWSFSGDRGFVGVLSSPVISGANAFVASGDGRVYAVDLSTGKQAWSASLDGSNTGLTLCGTRLLAIHQSLSTIEVTTGRIVDGNLLGANGPLLSGEAADSGTVVYLGGPTALVGVNCNMLR